MNQDEDVGTIPDPKNTSGNHSDLQRISITTGNSQTYITQAATASSRACVNDALTVLFQQEKYNYLPLNPTPDQIQQALYKANIIRLETLIKHDSLIVEAGNFAVVACWSPPDPPNQPLTENDSQNLVNEGRLHFKDFVINIEKAKVQHLYPLYGHRYWNLYLMARDPTRPYIPGAVRAVIAPFIDRARKDNVPIWLCAGSEHARNIYAHFGFRAVEMLLVGGNVPVWCMILEP